MKPFAATARLATLNPLVKLRYSATHKVVKNLLYRLTPFDAYQQGMVKKIEVLSVAEKNDEATLKIELGGVHTNGGANPKAKLNVWRKNDDGFKWKETNWLKKQDNIGEKSGNISYRDYTIERIWKSLHDQRFHLKFTIGIELVHEQRAADFAGLFRQLMSLTVNETKDKSGIYLDFFGGNGTTAQAVMELNKADNGNRQFILVQLPELTPEDSPAFKAGYKRISDITIERAKRVVQKLKTEAEGLLPNEPQRLFADSLGFKVYTLAKSAFPRVEFAPDPAKTEAENIELLKQYIREKEATFHLQFEKDKVLDEVLLKNGFMLDYTLTRQPEFKKNEVFLAKDAYKQSLVCLDAKLQPETVDHFKTDKDQFFICLELALDTTKKWNLKHNLGEKLKTI